MSERRRYSRGTPSPEPIVIERSPQVRPYRIIRPKSPERKRLTIGSKLYNLFKLRRKTVHFVEEVPVRSRYQERHIRPVSAPSSYSRPPPPPSPHRGPYYGMGPEGEGGIHTPLPPKLPTKPRPPRDGRDDRDHHHRYREVKIIQEHPVHQDAYPQVESPSTPPRKRDSGKYYVEDGPSGTRREYERLRPDPEVQKLVDELARERRDRREAEDKASLLEVELQHERRQRSLEARERAAADRENRLAHERHHLVEVRAPRVQREVVLHHDQAVAPTQGPSRSALDRARDDFRRSQRREDRRPATGTGDGRPFVERVTIIDDNIRHRDRDRDHGRR